MRLIIVGLALGMTAFTVIVAALRLSGGTPAGLSDNSWIFGIILVALAANATIILPLLRAQLVRQARARLPGAEGGAGRPHDSSGLTNITPADALAAAVGPYLNLSLITAAFAEGLGLFGAIVLLLTDAWLVLLAPGVALLIILRAYPTAEGLRRFASDISGRSIEIVGA
jgi:hypothetical protein